MWESVVGADKYEVACWEVASPNEKVQTTITPRSTFSDLKGSTEYQCKAKAKNSAGESGYSNDYDTRTGKHFLILDIQLLKNPHVM